MSYSLILFDCDGTLVDSEYLNNLAVLETLQHFGVNAYNMDYALEHFVGLRFSKIIADVSLQTGHTFPSDANLYYLKKVRELAQTHMHSIKNAKETVETAQQYSNIGVVSNGERNNVLLSLEFVGLRHYFKEEDIFTGLMAAPKPAPDLYVLAAKTMGYDPQKTLVIEDSTVGVTSGVAAGMTVWGFCGTHHNPAAQTRALLTCGAEKVFTSMNDLRNSLIALYGS